MTEQGLPKEHSTYGMISAHRSYCHPAVNLVGSDLKHNSFINLKISKATYNRNLNQDTWFEGDKLIEVHLSYSQWAEFLSSIGSTGVPCTLDWIKGQGSISDPVPFVDKSALHKSEFHNHFREDIKVLTDLITRLEVEVEEKAGKKQIRETIHNLKSRIMNFRANQDFAIDQFDESVENTLRRAKGEVKAFLGSLGINTDSQQIALPFKPEVFDNDIKEIEEK